MKHTTLADHAADPAGIAADRAPTAENDEELRQWLLQRLAPDGPFGKVQRVRWRVKYQIWVAVVGTATFVKRAVDVCGGAVLIVALMPVFLLVAALIRLGSPGPVFFSQVRVGRWGRHFRMLKFRSMYIDAEARKAALAASNEMHGGVTFKMKDDPRITRVGRFIRRASLDELPQLWNVCIGDMSLVGPRPPVPSEVAGYAPSDRRRLDGVPGITCLWQVSGRSTIPFPEQVKLDVAYLESQSLWLDLTLLLRTVPAVLLGRGAY
jgi:lipopolysaccharide/colanic/teichoic acid biosynthesis glycosyltransferase